MRSPPSLFQPPEKIRADIHTELLPPWRTAKALYPDAQNYPSIAVKIEKPALFQNGQALRGSWQPGYHNAHERLRPSALRPHL